MTDCGGELVTDIHVTCDTCAAPAPLPIDDGPGMMPRPALTPIPDVLAPFPSTPNLPRSVPTLRNADAASWTGDYQIDASSSSARPPTSRDHAAVICAGWPRQPTALVATALDVIMQISASCLPLCHFGGPRAVGATT